MRRCPLLSQGLAAGPQVATRPVDPRGWLRLQVNGVVQGAALMFQNLHTVVLRRATHLQDRALAALAASNGPRLRVRMAL